MADQIKSIIVFSVGASATVVHPHHLHINELGLIPDRIEPDAVGLVLTADDTNITAHNPTADLIVANVLAESWHSIERGFGSSAVRHLTPQPFIPPYGNANGIPAGACCPATFPRSAQLLGDFDATAGEINQVDNAQGSQATVTLPLAASVPNGTFVGVSTANPQGFIVALSGSDTYNFGTEGPLNVSDITNAIYLFVSDGVSDWYIISQRTE